MDETNKRPGAFWSAQRIKSEHSKQALFELRDDETKQHSRLPIDKERLKAASYELRMGDEVYVSPAGPDEPQTIQSLEPKKSFVIPPGQFAFLLTKEVVHVPKTAVALLALRSFELKFRGLVNVSGFHVDPGYHGRLVFAVQNAGPSPVHLRQGDPLFEIFFADLDAETDNPYAKPGLFHIEAKLIGSIAGEFDTFSGLKKKIEDVEDTLEKRVQSLEREQGIQRWATALLLAALVGFSVRYCTSTPANAAEASPRHAIEGGRR